MEIGVVSDVHANRVALDAVLDAMPDVDLLVNAGDVVGYNPWPAACVERVRELGMPTVVGNHDRATARSGPVRFNAMANAGVDHARTRLSDEQRSWLADLPDRRTVADGRVRIVHGHPENPDRYTYPEEFSPAMLDGEALLVTGHTHVQGHRRFDEGTVMNPGSVGQPRDGDPRAAYALVDLETSPPTVDERRVEYDVGRVVEAVEAAGLPRRIGERLREGR
ncbi:MAG: metallophosphoesterase [Haloferacaceae archaeon]